MIARPRRRRFTAEYKRSILNQADAAQGVGAMVSPLVKENRELLAANARLTKKLKNAELIIEVQKKVAALLGNPIPNIQIDEENS